MLGAYSQYFLFLPAIFIAVFITIVTYIITEGLSNGLKYLFIRRDVRDIGTDELKSNLRYTRSVSSFVLYNSLNVVHGVTQQQYDVVNSNIRRIDIYVMLMRACIFLFTFFGFMWWYEIDAKLIIYNSMFASAILGYLLSAFFENFIGGVLILLWGKITMGDKITIAGQTGNVVRINLDCTVLSSMTDKSTVVTIDVPNSYFFKNILKRHYND